MIIKFVAIVSPLLLVSACASAPVASLMPLEDGSYRSLAYSPSEQQALGSSLKLAETTCRERNLRHAIVNADTRYRGLPLRRAEPQETAAELAAYTSSPRFPALDANDDYEVKVLFKCV